MAMTEIYDQSAKKSSRIYAGGQTTRAQGLFGTLFGGPRTRLLVRRTALDPARLRNLEAARPGSCYIMTRPPSTARTCPVM